MFQTTNQTINHDESQKKLAILFPFDHHIISPRTESPTTSPRAPHQPGQVRKGRSGEVQSRDLGDFLQLGDLYQIYMVDNG